MSEAHLWLERWCSRHYGCSVACNWGSAQWPLRLRRGRQQRSERVREPWQTIVPLAVLCGVSNLITFILHKRGRVTSGKFCLSDDSALYKVTFYIGLDSRAVYFQPMSSIVLAWENLRECKIISLKKLCITDGNVFIPHSGISCTVVRTNIPTTIHHAPVLACQSCSTINTETMVIIPFSQ